MHPYGKCDKIPAVKDCRSSPLERAEEMSGGFLSIFRKLSMVISSCFFCASVIYCAVIRISPPKVGENMAYNFDFSYLKNGAPLVTLSSFGIAFNKGAIESLGVPDQVIIGYDQEQHAIGVRARGDDTISPCFDFAPRIKNDWIRIGAKDFIKYLSRVSKIDFLTKAKQFVADFDEETQTLIVVVDEEHLK